jgi:hypothetical protein
MTLLSVVKDVCATVGVLVPTSVFSNITGNRTMQEMLSLANEMAQRIAYDYRDWTALKAIATFVGDGVTTAFSLPADYKRMLLTSNVWRSTSTQQPMRFVPDADEWLVRRAANATDSAWGEWIILGSQIHIYPVMAAGVTANVAYLTKNCISLSSGGRGDAFMNDADTFVLDERTLKLGMVWQWKAQKGSPYGEDMGTYGDAITNMLGSDSPGPIIIGRRTISDSVQTAIPTQTIYVPGMVP